jgi:hypothetical protein
MTELPTLESYDAQAASAILARSILAHSPDLAITVPIGEPEQRVWKEAQEIVRRLGVNPDSPEAEQQIRSFLSERLQKLIAPSPAREKEIRERLGAEGKLFPEAYEIKFDAKKFRELGVTKSEVEAVLHSPDAVEHMLPKSIGIPEGAPAVSLFAKLKKVPRDPSLSYVMLVQAERKGSLLEVYEAWKVYESEVELKGPVTPMDILRAFVHRYGGLFKIGDDSEPTSMLLYTEYPLHEGAKSPTLMMLGRPDRPAKEGQQFHLRGIIAIRPERKMAIWAVVYFIDEAEYKETLRQKRAI